MGIFDFWFGKPVGRLARSGVITGADREFIKEEWAEVSQLLGLNTPSSRKDALIRADKVLDYVLKKISPGETMGKRLKGAQKSFSDYSIYDGLWKAHKVRNSLVHEAGFEPPHYVVVGAVNQIKAGLRDLGIILQ